MVSSISLYSWNKQREFLIDISDPLLNGSYFLWQQDVEHLQKEGFQQEKTENVLQAQLQQLVIERGYSWKEWLENKLPREIKWDITRDNSKNILRYLEKENK